MRSSEAAIGAGRPEKLSQRERATLRALADTLVPSLAVNPDHDGFYGRKASDLGVDVDVARIVEAFLSPDRRSGFRRVLQTVASPGLNRLLSGHPHRFSDLDDVNRERYLLAWSRSRLRIKRQGFQAVKRLVVFLAYAKALEDGRNPNWRGIGYDGPNSSDQRERESSEDFRIAPLRPERETTLETDVCVIGSGAGGSVIAAKLAALGHRVIMLEAGPYRTAADFNQGEADASDTMFQSHGVLTTKDLAFTVLAGQTAGGSATVNWMTCLRPPSWAREEWERAGLAGVAAPAFDVFIDEVWSRLHVNTDESVVNPSNDVLRRGSEALGYRQGVDYDVIPRNSQGCQARCDFFFFGCVYNPKQSPLVPYFPDAYAAAARFLLDTNAERVLIEGGEGRGVEAVFRHDGGEVRVHIRPRADVAAGRAIQTPALLLRSATRFPGVGQGLRLDPTTALFGEFPRPIPMWSRPMQTIGVDRFQGSDEGHHGPCWRARPAI